MSESISPPELPTELIVEIGYIASDWAQVEQNLLVHLLEMRNGDAANIPVGFKRLRREWLHECRKCLPKEDVQAAEELNDRLSRRSEARNYALHGTWTVTGEGQYVATVLEKSNDKISKISLPTPYETLTKQADLLRELRIDLWRFMDRVL